MQKEVLQTQLAMFDKLTVAITNIVLDYKPGKAAMLKCNLFTPLLVYLSQAVEMIDVDIFFVERRVMMALDLLSQLIDGEKPSQDWILNNVKIDQITLKLLNQRTSLPIAGQTSLFISQLTNANPIA